VLRRVAAAHPEGGAVAPTALPCLRVLVVDNDAQSRDAIASLLAAWRCDVRAVADGAAAARALADGFDADIWLLDYHLDEGDTGVAVRARLAAQVGDRPCLILSADGSGEVRRIALEHGLGLLPKPVKALALKSMLRRLVAARGA
jgi:CheY-like chemotaxis protein